MNINPISLNLKNISSIHNNNNNNNISVNSFDLSLTKNHSLNSENNHNSKRRRRNLILRGNQFRTFDNPSISDSNSSTHNSSAKIQNFSEKNVRKYLLLNEKIKHKVHFRNKNSILGNITNSYTLDNLQNEKDKKEFPKINNHISYLSSLTDRDYSNTNNNSRIEYNHHLSRNKNSTPIKLFNTSRNSNSLLNNDIESPKINIYKSCLINERNENQKNYNSIQLNHNKNIDIIRNINKKKLFSLNKRITRKVKTLFHSRNNNKNNIYEQNEKEKIYYKSDLEIELNKKINIDFKEKPKKKLNRRSVACYQLGKELKELKNIPEISSIKLINDDNDIFRSKNILKKKNLTTYQYIVYNTSSETDSEKSSESNNSSQNVKSVNLNSDITSFFMSPKKLKEKVAIIPSEHLKNFKIENDITEKYKNIDKKILNQKLNIIHSFQEKKFDLICSYQSNINKLSYKSYKDNRTNIQIINSLIIDKQIFFNEKLYQKPYFKYIFTIRNKRTPINKNFLNSYLLEKFIPIDIYNEVFKLQNLIPSNSENIINTNIFKNFELKSQVYRKDIINLKNIKTIHSPHKNHNKNKHKFNLFHKENILYLSLFHVTDYEFHIKTGVKQIKFEDIITNDLLYNQNMKKKTTHFLNGGSLRVLLKKEINKFRRVSILKDLKTIENEKKDKEYLKKSLEKTKFYNRKIQYKIKTKSKKFKISKKLEKEILLEKVERLEDVNHLVNKYQMISRVTDLKMKMIENLEITETLFFHIKDRNYPMFKSIFEKYTINPETFDKEGNSLLSLAVQSNSFLIVNYLINCGASVNTQNKNNNTPFHNFEIADMLIKSGADEKVKNKSGMTPWQCLDTGISII